MSKVAVISGASRGLGKTIVEYLAKEGYDLAIAARNLEALGEIRSFIEAEHGVKVFVRSVDFSKRKQINAFTVEVLEEFNSVDVVVNNLGIYGGTTASGMTELREMMNTNFYSAVSLTTAFLPQMQERRAGHIFNVCSIVSKQPRHTTAAYTISKDALYSYNNVLREEMREHGVKVSAIVPGSMNTSSWDGIDAPLDEMVQPEDIAKAIVYALSLSPNAYMEEIIVRQMSKEL